MPSLKFLNSRSKSKDTLKLLDLIHLQNKKHRIAIARLRCGNFNIRLRTGTWDNEPRELRLCRFCDCNEIEDEDHILLRCQHFDELRKSLIDITNQTESGVYIKSASELSINHYMNSETLFQLLARFVYNISLRIDQVTK
jgi:hypothetical protein